MLNYPKPKIQLRKTEGGGWAWRIVEDWGSLPPPPDHDGVIAQSDYTQDRESAIVEAQRKLVVLTTPEMKWHDLEEGDDATD